MLVRIIPRFTTLLALFAAVLILRHAAADDQAPKLSPDRQPAGDNFDITPLPPPFELDTQRTEMEQVVYHWPFKDQSVVRVIRMNRQEALTKLPPEERTELPIQRPA